MKIVVIGGSGLIGSKTVARLRKKGHEVVAASPRSGVDTFTGVGLTDSLSRAQVVVDLANSPSFEEKAAIEFFDTAGRNLLAAEVAAGVSHHVALSVVGTERLQEVGYFRGKMVQEKLVEGSGIPYTIIHSTQFFEFVGAIANAGAVGETVRLSSALMQPIAADDVADAVTQVALAPPENGIVEIAGPDRMRLSDIVGQFMRATNDTRRVIVDVHAPYFGMELNDQSLVPADDARIGTARFSDWLRQAEHKG